MKHQKLPAPPKDLAPETRAWWQEIVNEYVLESSHLRLLTLACRTWDRGEAARAALCKHGLTYTDNHGVKRPSPEATIEKNCAITFARLLRELRITNSEPEDTGRTGRLEGSPRRER
jgi:phage terminase small subunit